MRKLLYTEIILIVGEKNMRINKYLAETSIESAKEALKEALKGEDIEAIKAKQEELQKALYPISERI